MDASNTSKILKTILANETKKTEVLELAFLRIISDTVEENLQSKKISNHTCQAYTKVK